MLCQSMNPDLHHTDPDLNPIDPVPTLTDPDSNYTSLG